MRAVRPGSVVVGVDGSEHADRAVRWAAEQASLENRTLAVVAATRDERKGSSRVADAEAVARAHRPEIDVVTAVSTGDPRDVLTDLSSSAHLLVVGSRGRGAARSILLGSVSAALTRTAECPLVVCRPTAASSGGVVVGADASAESLPVLEFAFAHASMNGLPLTVVHCFWDAMAAVAGFREASGEVVTEPALEELRIGLAESLAGFREKYPDVPVELVLRHGLVDEALTRHGHTWDLVVVGRHPMDSFHRVLTGSIATAVVERAHCPVAVVPWPER